MKSNRARYKWSYLPAFTWKYRDGTKARHEGGWRFLRTEPPRPRNCRRGQELTQMRRLEQKQVRREGQALIRDELEWMAYERLLHMHASQYFEPKQGNQFHQDVETFTRHTLSGWELLDIEYERRYQEDMLMLVAELRDEEDARTHFDEDCYPSVLVEDEDDDYWEFPQFDGEDEFFQDEKPMPSAGSDLSHIRQAERMAASIRRHQQGRR